MTFKCQHYGVELRGYSTLSEYPTLAEAVESFKRIFAPIAGERPREGDRNPFTYRIVEVNKLGRIVADYTHSGHLVGRVTKAGVTVKKAPKELVNA